MSADGLTFRRPRSIGCPRSVRDLGAGTGKFTRLLAQTGADITAIEPVPAMLARLAGDLPKVKAIQGDAQHMPLADAGVDAVICAQAFHWFAAREALSEIHRVPEITGATLPGSNAAHRLRAAQ